MAPPEPFFVVQAAGLNEKELLVCTRLKGMTPVVEYKLYCQSLQEKNFEINPSSELELQAEE